MIDSDRQDELFKFLGEKLKKRIECFVIGGSAMMYYGIKGLTKDIDLVFENEKDREEIIKLLKEMGYRERDTKILYLKKKNTPILLQRNDTRLDLFWKKIINTVLSEGMKKRIGSVYEYSNLVVKVVSPEDLIITKCATERAGDRADASEIIKRARINWDIVIDESIYQAKVTPYSFPVFLFDFLHELKEDLKADIPETVIAKVRKIGERMLLEKAKKKRA